MWKRTVRAVRGKVAVSGGGKVWKWEGGVFMFVFGTLAICSAMWASVRVVPIGRLSTWPRANIAKGQGRSSPTFLGIPSPTGYPMAYPWITPWATAWVNP